MVARALSLSVNLTDLEAGGDLRLGELKIRGNELQELRSEFALSEGTLELQRLRAVIGGGGEVQGNASIDLSAANPVINADAELARIPVELLSDVFPDEFPVSGVVSGQAEAVVPVPSWNELRTWRIKGTAKSPQLTVDKWSLAGAATRVQLNDGILSLTEIRAQWLDSSVEGSLSLDIADRYPFDCQFVANEVPMSAAIKSVGRVPPVPLAGSLSVRGSVQGTLAPFTWTANGVASLPKLTAGDWQIDAAEGEWKANASALTLARGRASFLGGQVDVTGNVPLADDAGVTLRGTFREIAPTLLVQKITPEFDTEIGLTGFLSGEFSATDIQNSEKAAADIRFAGLNAQLARCGRGRCRWPSILPGFDVLGRSDGKGFRQYRCFSRPRTDTG